MKRSREAERLLTEGSGQNYTIPFLASIEVGPSGNGHDIDRQAATLLGTVVVCE